MSATLLQTKQPFSEKTTNVVMTPVMCDSCGGAVSAKYVASNGTLELNFCAHHIRLHSQDLKNAGWTITPENISFDAEDKPIVKTLTF